MTPVLTPERQARMRAGKERAARERRREQDRQLAARLVELNRAIDRAEREYAQSCAALSRARSLKDVDARGDAADEAMNRLQRLSAERRELEGGR